jgi:arylsulfatase A-like enzyme
MSLLSGKRPGALGFTNSYLRMEDRNAPTRHYAEALTLPKILADKGWRTAAFTGGDFLHGDYGFLYGFDTYGDTRIGPREARFTGEQAARWLAANHDQAFFLFVQSYQAQAPYQAPGARPGVQDDDTLRRWGSAWPLQHAVRSPTRAAVAPPAERPDLPDVTEDQRAQVRKLYASDVGEADALVARVLAALDENELWDHGGTLHGHTLYNELLHVPLVMRHPNVLPQGRTVERPVSLRHVAPTIVAALGLEMPDALGGQSLLPLMQGQEVDLPPVVAEAPFEGPWRRAVIADGWKLIRTAASDEDGAAQFELYDLATDPAEQVDRSASDEAQDLRLRLRGLLPPRPRTGDASPAK